MFLSIAHDDHPWLRLTKHCHHNCVVSWSVVVTCHASSLIWQQYLGMEMWLKHDKQCHCLKLSLLLLHIASIIICLIKCHHYTGATLWGVKTENWPLATLRLHYLHLTAIVRNINTCHDLPVITRLLSPHFICFIAQPGELFVIVSWWSSSCSVSSLFLTRWSHGCQDSAGGQWRSLVWHDHCLMEHWSGGDTLLQVPIRDKLSVRNSWGELTNHRSVSEELTNHSPVL